jgi:hypothetical protein
VFDPDLVVSELIITILSNARCDPNLLDDHSSWGFEHGGHEDQVVIILVTSRFSDGITASGVLRIGAIVIDEFLFLVADEDIRLRGIN